MLTPEELEEEQDTRCILADDGYYYTIQRAMRDDCFVSDTIRCRNSVLITGESIRALRGDIDAEET